MSSRPLTALLLLAACDSDHDHGHDGHDHAGQDHDAGQETKSAPSAPADFALGAWTASLEATAEGVRLSAQDRDGHVVTPSGEARIVLTGTGEEEQRVVLSPADGVWTGDAKAAGAVGYIAVVSLDIDGHTETARVTWGEVPGTAPAPKAEEPKRDDHDEGHGHNH